MPVPTFKHCLVCDDVRFEVGNKLGVTGLYGATPDATVLIANFALPVRLCFLFLGGPGYGEFTFRAQIRDRTGRAIAAPVVPERATIPFNQTNLSSIAVFWFPEIHFPKPDKYIVVLFSENIEIYSSDFQLITA